MAKLETIFCAMTWCLMNALLFAVAVDATIPADRTPPMPLAHIASASTTPVA